MISGKTAVIGAGISGLACAAELSAAGNPVEVFEKSRSLGGRVATRRWQGHVVDHGAPWFTLQEGSLLQEKCRAAVADGRLLPLASMEWDAEAHKMLPVPDGGRWYLPEGNNRLAAVIAQGIQPRMEVCIEELEALKNGGWRVGGEEFDSVVLTAPWPQTRKLLAPWLTAGDEPRYSRTLTAFFEFPGDPHGRPAQWSAIRHGFADAAGIELSICENHKPGRISSGRTVIVAHASPAFSEEWFGGDRVGWSGLLENTVREAWQIESRAAAVFTHRWGFSVVQGSPFRQIPSRLPPGLFVSGDSVAGSGVDAVYASGVQAAHAVARAFGR